MTPYLSFISNMATGTILKFAAIGVNSVPQKPHVKATIPTNAGSAPKEKTNGTPIQTVITVIAAKALPMIAVKITIPTA